MGNSNHHSKRLSTNVSIVIMGERTDRTDDRSGKTRNDAEEIMKQMSNPLSPASVHQIFLTHSDSSGWRNKLKSAILFIYLFIYLIIASMDARQSDVAVVRDDGSAKRGVSLLAALRNQKLEIIEVDLSPSSSEKEQGQFLNKLRQGGVTCSVSSLAKVS